MASGGGVLTREEAALLDDEAFFAAYRAGRIARPDDCLTEENWEEARPVSFALSFILHRLLRHASRSLSRAR
jgi:hypothetical protein